MRLVKLPEFDEGFVYINPEFVVSLYTEGEFTSVITNGGEDWRIPLPIDEVASRLVKGGLMKNGNTMHDIIENLRDDSHFASGGVVNWETIKKLD